VRGTRRHTAEAPAGEEKVTTRVLSRLGPLALLMTAIGGGPAITAGQVPSGFEIGYDPERIDPGHSYAVRGRTLVQGRLWFAGLGAFR
jgi:type III secretion system (T3SS) chaperone YscW